MLFQIDGTATRSWTADELLDQNGHVKSREDTRSLMIAAGTMYSGGIDTVCISYLDSISFLSPMPSDCWGYQDILFDDGDASRGSAEGPS